LATRFDLVVVAAGAGGVEALTTILESLPASFEVPIAVVQHRARGGIDFLTPILGRRTSLMVRQARDAELPLRGNVYVAPGDRHLLLGSGPVFRLWSGPPLRGARPAADVLFESAVRFLSPYVMAVVLTGEGRDGVLGALAVKRSGGVVLAQEPLGATHAAMPSGVVVAGAVDLILSPAELAFAIGALTTPA
jgi:two-component system chemotaxis response regulator CheB